MKFKGVRVKAVKVDLASDEISINLRVPKTDESMAMAEDLAEYTGKDASAVDVEVNPLQPPLLKEGKKADA